LKIVEDYAVLHNIHGEILSALAKEKEVHFGRRYFLAMWGPEKGDPGPLPGYLG